MLVKSNRIEIKLLEGKRTEFVKKLIHLIKSKGYEEINSHNSQYGFDANYQKNKQNYRTNIWLIDEPKDNIKLTFQDHMTNNGYFSFIVYFFGILIIISIILVFFQLRSTSGFVGMAILVLSYKLAKGNAEEDTKKEQRIFENVLQKSNTIEKN